MTTYLTDLPDFYVGTDLNDQVSGKQGGDVLLGEMGNDWLYGDGGNDWLAGGYGNDLLFGGEGSDTAYYGFYSTGVTASLTLGYGHTITQGKAADADFFFSIENLTGSNYNDILQGDANANVLKGLDGADSLRGMAGDDTLEGGAGGIDLLDGGTGADVLNGGDRHDRAVYSYSASGVKVNLSTGAASGGDATGDTFISIEGIHGSQYADALAGNAEANYINGGGGDDVVNGAAGDDTLEGWLGNDTLIGSGGRDTLVGGAGFDIMSGSSDADRFLFAAGDSSISTPDIITDFVHLTDTIYLDKIDAKTSTASDDAFTFIGAAAFTPGVAGQLRYAASGASTLIYGDTNGDAVADFAIQLDNFSGVLTAVDFFL
jgi:Ca2+-binding RTX toxin-like protein